MEHTTEAAQSINNDESAVAKAAGVIRLSEKQDIAHFFDRLSAETATELRVQRGYDSDADKGPGNRPNIWIICGVMSWRWRSRSI